MVRVPHHPRAHRGYVFEHIVVLEDVLGRHLIRDETVHHINGVKDDIAPKILNSGLGPSPAVSVSPMRWLGHTRFC